mmetsp:Transcript_59048/g.180120  ORF Transcript_59048/g.180120 Transcript_59048/m.180120 type:complete len:139 (-) Transcript_59048:156-572(-)
MPSMSAVLRVEAFLVMALLVAPDQPASGADAFSASGESRGTLDPVPGCKKGYLCCSLEGQPTVCVNKKSLNSGLIWSPACSRFARPGHGKEQGLNMWKNAKYLTPAKECSRFKSRHFYKKCKKVVGRPKCEWHSIRSQ